MIYVSRPLGEEHTVLCIGIPNKLSCIAMIDGSSKYRQVMNEHIWHHGRAVVGEPRVPVFKVYGCLASGCLEAVSGVIDAKFDCPSWLIVPCKLDHYWRRSRARSLRRA